MMTLNENQTKMKTVLREHGAGDMTLAGKLASDARHSAMHIELEVSAERGIEWDRWPMRTLINRRSIDHEARHCRRASGQQDAERV